MGSVQDSWEHHLYMGQSDIGMQNPWFEGFFFASSGNHATGIVNGRWSPGICTFTISKIAVVIDRLLLIEISIYLM
jgi:hypothetical protein